jgi:riboflavin kinase/FMN adenylyltransferase
LFDFNGDLYGKPVVVRWYKKLRDEKKFSSVDALIERMNVDADEARAHLASFKA